MAATLLVATTAGALEVVPPPYQQRTEAAGVVRVWGTAELRPLLDRWASGFQRVHPAIRIEAHLTGTDVGMAALYTGKADLALAGREASANEAKAFEWIHRYKPSPVEVATGFETPGRSPALVACVNAANPLSQLTLAQLDAIFSHERLQGFPRAIVTWGDLGLTGEWAAKPINLYTFDTESGSGRFFRGAVLKDSRKLNWERLTEFSDTATRASHDAARKIFAALARDRYGLAVASGRVPPSVKVLALPVEPTREAIASRRYPLARAVHAYFNAKPGTALDAPLADFLRFVLSEEGQRLAGEGDYLPLDSANAARQRETLAMAAGGVIRIVGYNDMKEMLEPIARRFEAAHPGVKIQLDLPGTRFAPAALASGESALAPMGAVFTPAQLAEYRARAGLDPLAIRVAHASLDAKALSGPLAVFVNRDNPLPSLTLGQLARVFSGDLKTWDDLGLGGAWSQMPITAYGVQEGTALANEMREKALMGRGFARDLRGFPQSVDVVDRVGKDPHGIGFAAAMRATPEVRALPIAPREGAEPVALTAGNIVAGRYPLDRYLWVYVRPPISLFAREFLRLMLSAEGQDAIAASPQRYLPLSAAEAREEQAKLD